MLDLDPASNALRTTLNAAQAQFDLCIIDTPPAAPEWLAEALGAADLVLIPVSPLARRSARCGGDDCRRERCPRPIRLSG